MLLVHNTEALVTTKTRKENTCSLEFFLIRCLNNDSKFPFSKIKKKTLVIQTK